MKMNKDEKRKNDEIRFRKPTAADGAAMAKITDDSKVLDMNSVYAYLLVGDHFAGTSVVAESPDGDVVGFVSGYVPPGRDDTYFLWQVGVDESWRGHGLATRMVNSILDRASLEKIRFLETTVTPSNVPSTRLFQGLARRWGTELKNEVYYPADMFGGGDHEDEIMFKIGPIERKAKEVNMETIERLESEVRGYVRNFPTVFKKGRGAILTDKDGKEYIDFFAGAGALSYGHNNPEMKKKLIDYISSEQVVHSLDMATDAKIEFLRAFEEIVLKPRKMDYKVQFPGPTGTNSVEAALKLARKYTGRSEVISFTNGFHGMTLGSLAVTGNMGKRHGAGVKLHDARSMPFDGYHGSEIDTIELVEKYLDDTSSGVEKPAAFILETVQAEGGVNPASMKWLNRLSDLARRHEILLIVDDIQVGCGRTGTFFSFEPAGIQPDIICLSKSLSGYGLPFAVTLMKPELDVWSPGEHNGTFRGHNLAFVTAKAALETFWKDDQLTENVKRREQMIRRKMEKIADRYEDDIETIRGRGMIQGIVLKNPKVTSELTAEAFSRGVIIETAGTDDEVLKFLPPLVIEDEVLEKGLNIVEDCFKAVLAGNRAGYSRKERERDEQVEAVS